MSEETSTTRQTQPPQSASLLGTAFTRRRFLVGTGTAAGLVVATAACGNDDEAPLGGATTTTQGQQGGAGDAQVASLAAGLEVLAVNTYQQAAAAAQAGKLGQVPPAVSEYVKTALAHHQEALQAWNKVLKSAGQPEVNTPNAKLKPTVDAEFAKVKDVTGAARLALMLEGIAADTYLKALPTLQSADARKQAAQIQAVDQQHRAVLLFVLGEYPVPEVFQSTEDAVTA